MSEPSLLGQIHFWIGCAAIIAGFAAFTAKKGHELHIASGRIFVISMTLLAISGLWLSIIREILFTVFLSALAFHLIITAWASAAHKNSAALFITKISPLVSGALCGGALWGAWLANASPQGLLNDLPPGAFLTIAATAFVIAAFDFAFARAGEKQSQRRIARHLWRMGFAFFLATGIFFFGNNHVLPETLRHPAFLSIPVLAVVIWTAFFAVKLRFFDASKTKV